MNHNQASKWACCVVGATLAALLPIGCDALTIFQSGATSCRFDAPVKPAEYPLTFKDGPKKGKDVVVAVFISSAPGNGSDFATSPYLYEKKLASDLAKTLPEMAKESKPPQKLTVLDPSDVNKFKTKYVSWKSMHPSEWGRMLNVDFVLDVHLDKMSLYQPGSNNKLLEGRAEVTVNVYDVDAGPGEPKYNYVLPYSYPHTGMLDATSIPVNRFKQDYLEHLAAELSMKHVSHKQDSEIADER